jgi:hypothetical protein
VEYRKQEVVKVLRRAGFWQAADDAMRDLPDPVELDYVTKYAETRGISRDVLIDKLGGSP